MSSVYWLARAGIALAGRTPLRVRHAPVSTATTATYLGWHDKRLATRENMAKVLGLPAATVERGGLPSPRGPTTAGPPPSCLPVVSRHEGRRRARLGQGRSYKIADLS